MAFWMICPCDSHTCAARSCLLSGCGGLPAASVPTGKPVDEPPAPKPDKEDPMTWEVKVS